MIPAVETGALLGGTYRIVRRIGGGGMGEVYEAVHERLAHRYAVKFLHPGVRDHPEALPRFMREAQVTSRLRHPGIVSVVDFNTLPGGTAYLVMEFLEGESLGKLLRRMGPLPLPRVVDITDQLSSALTAAHLQGVVHRDMHPQNVFVVPGTAGQSERIKILDFGISKIASISQKITGMAAVMGTPQYMSPEQAEGKADELDAASDQFSLAAIVYELLTGKPAFSGETLASVAYQIVHARPATIQRYRPELPTEIDNVVSRALSKDKKDRFPSVSEFAVHLRWTATLPGNDVVLTSREAQSAPTAVGFDAEETTAVSKLPSDMAAVLRETTSDITLRTDPGNPSKDGKRTESVNDELTVVSGQGASGDWGRPVGDAIREELTVALAPAARTTDKIDRSRATPPHHEPTIMVTHPSRRRSMIIAAVVGGALVIVAVAIGIGVRTRRAQPEPPAAAAPANRAPVAPGPAKPAVAAAKAKEPEKQADERPSAHPEPAAAREAPADHAEPVAEHAEPEGEPSVPHRAAGRTHGHTATAKAPTAIAERAERAAPTEPAPAGGGQCSLTVGTYPWSDLWIDGADTGQHTPVVALPIPCGPHRLEFKRRDLRIDQIERVNLTDGHPFKRQYELQGSGVDD